MLQNNPELKSKIDQLWNKFWSGGISNPLTAIEQSRSPTRTASTKPV
jgi:type I restriction enzyme M protein